MRKAQVSTAQFVQVPLGSPFDQWQRRIGARGENQVHLRGQMSNQHLEQRMHFDRANEVIIIQHQDHVFWHIGQIVAEQGCYALRGGELRCGEEAGGGQERIRKDALQSDCEGVCKDG